MNNQSVDNSSDAASANGHYSDEPKRSSKAAPGCSSADVRQQIEESAQRVRENVESKVQEFSENLDTVTDELRSYVRSKPMESVAMAVGAGLAIGFLLRRK